MSGWLVKMLSGLQDGRFVWTKRVSARGLGATVIGALLMLVQNSVAYAVMRMPHEQQMGLQERRRCVTGFQEEINLGCVQGYPNIV